MDGWEFMMNPGRGREGSDDLSGGVNTAIVDKDVLPIYLLKSNRILRAAQGVSWRTYSSNYNRKSWMRNIPIRPENNLPIAKRGAQSP